MEFKYFVNWLPSMACHAYLKRHNFFGPHVCIFLISRTAQTLEHIRRRCFRIRTCCFSLFIAILPLVAHVHVYLKSISHISLVPQFDNTKLSYNLNLHRKVNSFHQWPTPPYNIKKLYARIYSYMASVHHFNLTMHDKEKRFCKNFLYWNDVLRKNILCM